MLDTTIRRWIDPTLNRVATGLAYLGLGANAVTVLGFGFGLLSWVALAFTEYSPALIFIISNRSLDGLDGALARKLGSSDLGGYLDITLDFIFYAGVPFFFAVGRPDLALPAAFLVFSFVGTGSSFLAFASVAARRGSNMTASKSKTIHYLGGLTEGTETIALFLLICLFPEWFTYLAWGFGGLCWLTTATRIYTAYQSFREHRACP